MLPLAWHRSAHLDLNYLFSREQISMAHAIHAASLEARASHAGLAEGYAALIDARSPAGRAGRRRTKLLLTAIA